ncbi:ATP-binding protein [Bifidobacterium felsineum]|uniref:Sensor-like histidine kinase SenX3 n=1 Tax=Bifidobacterium felsineum TaxID=2045440 RepID=A0A2M9HMX8_9BIFI|nr:ATP-binding protein [Bifidobacterium felsineum]MBT1163945.1 ATP-binding protein [Bifidobacterium felsineum]PJM78172.1 two-component sensor histidine kinase [Bifidobacterium felsineum]
MSIWQFIVIVVLLALALAWAIVISYGKGRASGRAAAEEAFASDEDAKSLFGDDVPVRPTERRLIEVLPEALIVTDRNGLVHYASPGSVPFGLVSGKRINSREVEDILTQAASDGGVREREVQLPLDRGPFPSLTGKGIEAGQLRPSNTRYLRVRIGDVGDDLYAIFISDMSEQRRFEAVRRDFVTNVSHELKTPAGAISLLAETVTDAADDPDAVRYFSGRISKESARLTELVHHLIDLQRAQSSQGMSDTKRISALAVARAAISDNQVQAEAHHVDIRLNANGRAVPLDSTDATEEDVEAGKNLTILADADAMQTAVKNLVENAIHYSPEHTTVAVDVAARNGKVTIRVVDQGIGIPEESLDRVFERFYRVDPARSRQTGGSGLGLAITKHCVQENGGRISVWSRQGEGSTFTIELPAAAQKDTQPATKAKEDKHGDQ